MIVESRWLAYKNKDKKFVKDRRAICEVCPFSSKNKKSLTIKELIYKLLNLGNYCTACGCSLKYKTAHPESVCGLEELEEKPKWEEHYEL